MTQLFQLYVVVRSMLPVGVDVEQHVDLVQVSADTRCALAPDLAHAQDKLTGMQLHHFGAFYKSSWRANDWMWGRLDGAGWIVHLLLDPKRILLLAETAQPAPGTRVAWFLGQLAARIPGLDVADAAVETELAYLDAPATPPPASLPTTAMWLATVWQRRIAVAELPVIAQEIVVNPSLRANPWAVTVLEHANTPETVLVAARSAMTAMATGKWNESQEALHKWAAQQPAPDLSGPDVDSLIASLATCPVPRRRSPARSASRSSPAPRRRRPR